MPNIDIRLPYNPATGKYASTVSLEVVGTVGHGLEMTMRTDGTYNFGTRTNVKPLYVNLGVKAGSSYGRDTADYFQVSGVEQTSVKAGSVAGAVRFDFKYLSTISAPAIFGDIDFNPAKPLIQYIERYYAFDIRDPDVWGANGAGTGVPGFNLKTNRLYYDLSPSSKGSPMFSK